MGEAWGITHSTFVSDEMDYVREIGNAIKSCWPRKPADIKSAGELNIGESMPAWVPDKHQLEIILQEIRDKLKSVNTVSEIEGWLDDAIATFECHVYNRAKAERKQANTATDTEPTKPIGRP